VKPDQAMARVGGGTSENVRAVRSLGTATAPTANQTRPTTSIRHRRGVVRSGLRRIGNDDDIRFVGTLNEVTDTLRRTRGTESGAPGYATTSAMCGSSRSIQDAVGGKRRQRPAGRICRHRVAACG
jgi:hypothetical protein